jgi:NADPH:quinone reductase
MESRGAAMQAMVVPQTGGPDVLELRDVPAPTPAEGEVSIDVAYAGVNYAEVMERRGDYQPADLPFVPGLEVSRRVAAVGPGVTGFEVGQTVAAMTAVGGYAEIAVAKVPLVMAIPENVDLQTAGGFSTITPTAYALLVDVARLRKGETVLVHAAAGGMGTVLGQIARYPGAGRVIGTVGSSGKIPYARRFGYDIVVEREGFVDSVRRETNGRGVDIVLDSVGDAVLTESLGMLAPLGRVVIFGNSSQSPAVHVESLALFLQNAAVMGYSIGMLRASAPAVVTRQARAALALVADGDVRIDVTGIFPLGEAREAHRRLEGGRTTGKLLLSVNRSLR